MGFSLDRAAVYDVAAKLDYRTQAFIDGAFHRAESGDSLPSYNPATGEKIADIAKELGVEMIYTMAAYPNDVYDEPQVYGIYTDDSLRPVLEKVGVKLIESEGAVNGLNGVMIGVAKLRGIDGVCLMGDITYANVPTSLF